MQCKLRNIFIMCIKLIKTVFVICIQLSCLIFKTQSTTHRMLRAMAVEGRQLGERQTQSSLETPLLNDDDNDDDDENDDDDDDDVSDVTNSCTF